VAGRAKTRPQACGAIARNVQESRGRQRFGAASGGMSATIVLQLVQVATTVSGWSESLRTPLADCCWRDAWVEALIVATGQLCWILFMADKNGSWSVREGEMSQKFDRRLYRERPRVFGSRHSLDRPRRLEHLDSRSECRRHGGGARVRTD
jgi:hypothetical protein